MYSSKVFLILGVNEDRYALLGTQPALAPCFEGDGIVLWGMCVSFSMCLFVSVEATILKSPLYTDVYMIKLYQGTDFWEFVSGLWAEEAGVGGRED